MKEPLVLEPLSDGSFKYISGPKEGFEELAKYHQYYELHTTKQGIAVEDCEKLCRLIERVALGTEQGFQSSSQHTAKAVELKQFMESRGHQLHLAYLTE